MIPALYCVAKVVGTAVVGATSAACAALVAVPVAVAVQEGVKAGTRDEKGLGGYTSVIKKLENMRYSLLPKDLRDHVVKTYIPKSRSLNYISAGSSNSSRRLLSEIKATDDRDTLYRLFNNYLYCANSGDCRNDGKKMCVIITNYINYY